MAVVFGQAKNGNADVTIVFIHTPSNAKTPVSSDTIDCRVIDYSLIVNVAG